MRAVATLLLIAGFVIALDVLAIAVLWDVTHGPDGALSRSTNELLTGWGSGIATGVLGVLLAFKVARTQRDKDDDAS